MNGSKVSNKAKGTKRKREENNKIEQSTRSASVVRENTLPVRRSSSLTSDLNKNKKHKDDLDTEQVDFIKEALKKVQELEQELLKIDDSEDTENEDESVNEFERNANAFQAEAFGFAVCARETFEFLAGEGFMADNPLIQSLRNRLIGPPRSASI